MAKGYVAGLATYFMTQFSVWPWPFSGRFKCPLDSSCFSLLIMSKCWLQFFTYLLGLHTWNPCCVAGLRRFHTMVLLPTPFQQELSSQGHQVLYWEGSAKHQTFWTILTFGLLNPCAFNKLDYPQVAKKHWRGYTPMNADQAAWSNEFISAYHALVASRW